MKKQQDNDAAFWAAMFAALIIAVTLTFATANPTQTEHLVPVSKTVVIPPADYAATKAENVELKTELDVARASAKRVPPHTRTSSDDVAKWMNLGAYRAYQTCR